MDADLDLLLTAVYVTADDLLPEKPGNARRSVTDAEVVTLCVAQAIMGIPSDRRFLAVAAKRLRHLFPQIPAQPGYFKRRRRLVDTLEWLMESLRQPKPRLLRRSACWWTRRRWSALEAVRRSSARRLADAADYGYCTSHSRFFWGFRLHAIFAPDGTPRAITVASPKRDEREVALELLARTRREGTVTLIGDKGYAGREFASHLADMGATIIRPRRKDERGRGPHLAPIRQRIESIFWTCKDILTLERHGARTLPGLRERILQRFLCLAAAVTLNHELAAPAAHLPTTARDPVESII